MKQIREANRDDICLSRTKLLDLTERNAMQLYQKLSRLKSKPNRAKLYRLIHGDVYCMARTYRFGLTDNDRCVCCFEEGTIRHLLLECSYTREVWSRLGITYNRPEDILNGKATVGELEIRAALIAAIVFGKNILPPEILINVTVDAFSRGLSRVAKTQHLATSMAARYQITKQWFW